MTDPTTFPCGVAFIRLATLVAADYEIFLMGLNCKNKIFAVSVPNLPPFPLPAHTPQTTSTHYRKEKM